MTDKKSAPDRAKEDEKQLKKLLESYTTVAAHKLGRPPTLEDLTKMLTENTDQEQLGAKPNETPVTSKPVSQRSIDKTSETTPAQPAQGAQAKPTTSDQASQPMDKASEPPQEGEPAVLGMQVYYGMGGDGEARQPDPSNILFYKHPDGRFFDCGSQAWSDAEPPMARHLPSRAIQFNERDIVAAIAHGVMDDGDFEALDKAQMIGPTPRALWEKMIKLKGLYTDLKKSEEADDEVEVDPDLLPSEKPTEGGGVDAVGEFFSTAGVERSSEEPQSGEVGEDLIRQIMEAAVSAVSEVMSSEMEEKIRTIVREELGKQGGGEDLQPTGESDTMIDV